LSPRPVWRRTFLSSAHFLFLKFGGNFIKKVISLAIALVLCLSIFAGCGAKEVNLADLMDKMNSEYSVDATKYETKDDMYKYYNINADDIKQFAAEVGKSDTDSENTEVVLVEATDSDAASRVETALTNRYNSIFQQNASYSAEDLDMVKNCKVTKDGNFVTMIIGEKASDMLKMFNDSIK